MNGLLIILVLLACFISGAEASAPGVTVSTVTAIDEVIVANQLNLKERLEEAIANPKP